MVGNIVRIETMTPVVVTRDKNTGEDMDEKDTKQVQYHSTNMLALSHNRGLYLRSSPMKVTSKPATK